MWPLKAFYFFLVVPFQSYIRDLEGQIENPDNSAFIKRIDACIERVDSLEMEKKG